MLFSSVSGNFQGHFVGLRLDYQCRRRVPCAAENESSCLMILHNHVMTIPWISILYWRIIFVVYMQTCNVPLPTNKCSKDSQNLNTSQVAISSAKDKTKEKSVNTTLPDINQELPTLASPVVDWETSTSKSQSLHWECLLSYADKDAKSKSSTCGNCSLGPEPSSRWIKRLKLGKSDSAYGTKSAKIVENSSPEKVNKTFIKIMKRSKTSLESRMLCHAEEQVLPNRPASEFSFAKVKQTVEMTLSHLWIQRWSHNRAASSQKRHELVELCEPKFSNTLLYEFQRMQFPGIAAKALMGKATSSLNPYELTKMGSIVVWGVKGF